MRKPHVARNLVYFFLANDAQLPHIDNVRAPLMLLQHTAV
jgi:hypothetical protein